MDALLSLFLHLNIHTSWSLTWKCELYKKSEWKIRVLIFIKSQIIDKSNLHSLWVWSRTLRRTQWVLCYSSLSLLGCGERLHLHTRDVNKEWIIDEPIGQVLPGHVNAKMATIWIRQTSRSCLSQGGSGSLSTSASHGAQRCSRSCPYCPTDIWSKIKWHHFSSCRRQNSFSVTGSSLSPLEIEDDSVLWSE